MVAGCGGNGRDGFAGNDRGNFRKGAFLAFRYEVLAAALSGCGCDPSVAARGPSVVSTLLRRRTGRPCGSSGCAVSQRRQTGSGRLGKLILQFDLADLDERRGVRVLRDIRDDFLGVGSEACLIGFERMKKKMTGRYVWRSRSRLLAGNPMFDGHALQSGSQ